MTISTTINKVSYSGNGATTTFAYTFKVFSATDLKVYIRDASGTETLQTITTHYTVSNVGNASGGNVDFVTPPSGTDKVIIQRVLPLTQTFDYVLNDPFPSDSHEDGLDKLTLQIQQVQEEVDRSIKASVTNEITLDSPNTVETLAFYAKLANVSQEGPLAWERSQLTELFNDEKIAMYINGPWGRGQHKEELNVNTVRIPAGPNGQQGTLLITDSVAVFNNTGHEDLASQLVAQLCSGDAQYDLDTSWGLTPIMQYPQIGRVAPYNEDYWTMFIDAIADGGPEPLFVDYKAFQSVMNSMIQGAILGEGDPADLVAEAAEELEEYK